MKTLVRSLAVVLIAIPALAWNGAPVSGGDADMTPEAQQALARSFGFLPAQMYKLSHDHNLLRAADLDGDGRIDLAVVDNNRARVDLLYNTGETGAADSDEDNINEAGMEDRGFRKEHYATDTAVRDLALADINADGAPDLAYLDERGNVILVLREKEGWSGRNRLRADGYQMLAADLNGDGRVDFALLEASNLGLLMQEADGGFAAKVSYPMGVERALQLTATDLNGDGLIDLAYLYPNDARPIRFRLQQRGGFFGSEQASDRLPTGFGLQAVNVDGRPGDELLYLLDERGAIKALSHEIGKGDSLEAFRVGDLQSYTFAADPNSRSNRSMSVSDIDGDGRPDIMVTDPETSQLLMFQQDDAGGFRPFKAFPTLLNVQDLQAGARQAGERDVYFSLSREESSIGMSRVADGGQRLEFPAKVHTVGKPAAMCVADCLGDGAAEFLYVSANDSQNEFTLHIVSWGDLQAEAETLSQVVKLTESPSSIQVLDLNADGRKDILIYQPSNPVALLVQNEKGGFDPLADGSGAGILANAKPGAVKLVDLNGDGVGELLVGYKNLVRVMRLREGVFEVVDQFSGKDARTNVVAVDTGDLDGDGSLEIILVDDREKQVQILARESEGASLWVYRQNVELPDFIFRDLLVRDVNVDGKPDVVVLGKRKFGVLFTDAVSNRLVETTEFTTAINKEQGRYGVFAIGDLNMDSVADVILYETSKNMVEILTTDAEGALVHAREFKLYKTDPLHRDSRMDRGVREMLLADLNKDGKNDVVLLVHDRILVFPQE